MSSVERQREVKDDEVENCGYGERNENALVTEVSLVHAAACTTGYTRYLQEVEKGHD
jgi:hypothetical protein